MPSGELRPVMRRLLYAAAVLVFLAGVQLFVFPERTERYFAWTIQPHLTAVFLGGAYWSSVIFEVVAARQRRWADARIAVPTVFVFTVLTLLVTLVHLENFHLGSGSETATRAVTWIWIAIYATVPVLMVGVMAPQARGGRSPRVRSGLPRWLVATVALQAILLLGMGTALLVAPTRAAEAWPWELTPLTGRAIGAWLVSLGVAAVHSLWEGEPRRLRPAAAAYLVFGVLQTVALARYPELAGWTSPEAIAYLVFLASTVVVGGVTLLVGRTEDRPVGTEPHS